MYLFLQVLHVVVCFFIIGIVLMQSSGNANVGSMLGGGSQTVFGSSAQTTLGKMTTTAGTLFFVVCLLISFVINKDRSTLKREEMVGQISGQEVGSINAGVTEEGPAPEGLSGAAPTEGEQAAPVPAPAPAPAPTQ